MPRSAGPQAKAGNPETVGTSGTKGTPAAEKMPSTAVTQSVLTPTPHNFSRRNSRKTR